MRAQDSPRSKMLVLGRLAFRLILLQNSAPAGLPPILAKNAKDGATPLWLREMLFKPEKEGGPPAAPQRVGRCRPLHLVVVRPLPSWCDSTVRRSVDS
jgi:hypothetical protein